MDNTLIGRHILLLILGILLGFGIIVCVLTLVLKRRGGDVKSLWIRYSVWFLIVPPILLPLIFSKYLFHSVILLLSVLCFREYARVTGLWKDRMLVLVGYCAIACIYFPVYQGDYGFYQAFPIWAVLLILLVPVVRGEFEHMIQKSCLAVLGVVYFGWFLSHLAYMRNVPHGIEYVFFLMLLVESNDAFAYIWGKLFGRHRLTPKISPNKTVEGAIGGIVSVVILALCLRYLLPFALIPHVVAIALLISVFGMVGDLTISFIKRDLKIKDTGDLIPGHGGLLDRFDSLIYTVPIYFHFFRFFYYGT
jgi:phosphatidate cytidylyltransferase